ncbi:DUF2934 domain-containing protein [Nostoc sp. CCY0012]|uniref:DUF2934 domain-containing protein n=1 Tax=Nostoc sp. CCY0012 TaxID=1056123 RepID=UPI0039C734BE
MPYDVTKCPGKNCPVKQKCSRFTNEILGRQDFFGEAPYNFTTNSCEHFINNCPDENKIRLKAYEIWQQMGYQEGKSVEYWLQAEKALIDLGTYT